MPCTHSGRARTGRWRDSGRHSRRRRKDARRVGVRDGVRAVEEYSGGIEEPARAEQRERPRREENERGLYGDDAQPAHEHVGEGREGGIATRGQDLEDYTDRRESPRQAEERPAPASAHAEERYRSIRPGYEQVYRAVVQHPQGVPRPRSPERVIQRRGRLQRYERNTVNGRAN